MHYFALAGGGLIVVGCFLPWIQLGALFIQRGIDNADGSIALVVGLLVVGVALFNIIKKKNEMKFIYLYAGLAIFAIGVFDLIEIKKRINEMSDALDFIQAYLDMDRLEIFWDIMGMGCWFVCLGGVILLVVGLVDIFAKSESISCEHYPSFNDIGQDFPEPPQISRTAILSGITGKYSGQQIPVPAEGLVMGRDPSLCSLVFQSTSVSRRHARLSQGLSPDNWILEDLNSTNGTFVLEKSSWVRISAPVTLSIFKRFRLGDDGNEFEIR